MTLGSMNVGSDLVKSIQPRTAFWFLVSWAVLWLIGIYLNGGFGPYRTVPSLLTASLACASLGGLSFATLFSARFQTLVLRPSTLDQARPGLIISGTVGTAGFAALLLEAWWRIH
jgi:fucose permease